MTPSAEGAPPSALRVLLSGWLNSRLVQLGLDYCAMTVTHNGSDAMDDGAYHTNMLMFDEEDHAPPRTSPSAVED